MGSRRENLKKTIVDRQPRQEEPAHGVMMVNANCSESEDDDIPNLQVNLPKIAINVSSSSSHVADALKSQVQVLAQDSHI